MEFVAYAAAEYLSEATTGQIPTNNVNHYLDILAFDRWGKNTLVPNRYVQPGTVLDRLSIPGLDVYHALIQFMTSPTGTNRPLCTSAIGPCTGGSGVNGLYLFAYDWRGGLDTEAQRLSDYVDQVLNRPDVRAAGVEQGSAGHPQLRWSGRPCLLYDREQQREG